MAFDARRYFRNYFKKKSIFSIVTDFLFILLIVLMIIPSTRTQVSSFFIKVTSLPPSELNADEQFSISNSTNNWILYDMKGNEHKYSDLNKKPVFLNVWATWCPPCIAELPSIKDLHADYGQKVNFILVSNENPDVVKAFIEKNNYQNLDFYISKNLPQDFTTQSIPATFVISTDSKVVVNKKGAAKWNSSKMTNILDNLIQD
jgi:thiol-disulfide isomerase/thioredoxin